jgi:hypothetical protein
MFVTKARKVHGDKYSYPPSSYTNQQTKIPVVCRAHGKWLVTPDSHINGGTGCPKCALDARPGQGPKQVEAKRYEKKWIKLYPDSSIAEISRNFGFTFKVVADVLRGRGIRLLSSKEINERKYRNALPLVEGHLNVIQPVQWDRRGRRLYECRGPSHFRPIQIWLKPNRHTACNRNCARQRHTFSHIDKLLRASGSREIRWWRRGLYLRDSVVSYVCPHGDLVKQEWRSLARAIIHTETICPHVDNFWSERAIRLFVRRAVLPGHTVAVGPTLIKLWGGNFSFDITVLKNGNPVAYIEPGSHQNAVRYGG